MNTDAISVDKVTLSRIALTLAARGQYMCAICGHVTDDATKPCPNCGAPDGKRDDGERRVLH